MKVIVVAHHHEEKEKILLIRKRGETHFSLPSTFTERAEKPIPALLRMRDECLPEFFFEAFALRESWGELIKEKHGESVIIYQARIRESGRDPNGSFEPVWIQHRNDVALDELSYSIILAAQIFREHSS